MVIKVRGCQPPGISNSECGPHGLLIPRKVPILANAVSVATACTSPEAEVAIPILNEKKVNSKCENHPQPLTNQLPSLTIISNIPASVILCTSGLPLTGKDFHRREL